MKILVPFKPVSDPSNANKVKVTPDGARVTSDGIKMAINPFDDYALETALRLNENAATKESLGETVVVTIAPKEVSQIMLMTLAQGAARGIRVDAGDDVLDSQVVARVLKAIVDKEKPDVVLMGKQAVDGDSNTVGQVLAEMLGWPMATFAATVGTTDGGKTFSVGREVDTGVLTLKVTGPAIITVDLRILGGHAVKNGVTPAEFGYPELDAARNPSMPAIMKAKNKPVATMTLAELGVDTALSTKYRKYELPAGRSGQAVFVESVDELVKKLHTDAKVI